MRLNFPSGDGKKTIPAWQKFFSIGILGAEAAQVANFPSEVLTDTLIWFPLRVMVLSPVAKAERAGSPLRSAQVSP